MSKEFSDFIGQIRMIDGLSKDEFTMFKESLIEKSDFLMVNINQFSIFCFKMFQKMSKFKIDLSNNFISTLD